MAFAYFKKRKRFKKILKDIKEIKIQGATNVAKSALEAYLLFPSKRTKRKLLSLRPTEPMLHHVLNLANEEPKKEILSHFDFAQEEINKFVLKIIKEKDVIFTHCHSTNVVKALINAKKEGKHFEVYNTETRPLYQGRKTSRELSTAKIKVTQFVDSAFRVALLKTKNTKKVSKIFLGADALLKNGIINKIGSATIAEIARDHKIPLYIIADSWKFSEKNIEIEQRTLNEVWDKAPEKIKIQNPAFEFVDKKYIKKIISEKGILDYEEFVKKFK